jgi:glycosyltransferase involved in cell wall biosynthesis
MAAESVLRVTAIIPSYNRANYLPLAVDSILAQSYPVLEIIIVDDGSTDNTPEVAKSFDDKVRFYERGHQGVSAARNTGLELAQGDVVAWCDADDEWEPDFLSSVMPLLETDPGLAGVYTGFAHIDQAGNRLPHIGVKTVPPSELFSALIENDFVLTPTLVVRRKCFETVGGFDTDFQICEDYDMWLRLAKQFLIAGLPTPLVRVRVHGGNTIGNQDALLHYRLLLIQKHFGPPEGDPAIWIEDKRRAYAYAYAYASAVSFQSGEAEQGWQFIEKASLVWPKILEQLDIFYELAVGDQSRGYRGQADLLDIAGNGKKVLAWLDDFFSRRVDLNPLKPVAYGNAYLALGMLSDQARLWTDARHYLSKAIRSNPRLLTSFPVMRRLAKVCAGPLVVERMKKSRERYNGH